MAAKIVREAGGKVTLAHNLAGACESVAAKTFDLVLLDNHLPDGKGYDFFDQLSRRNPDAPVVMVTGVPDLSEAVSLTRNGLFEYLTKPLSVDALAACLHRAKLRMRASAPASEATEWFGESSAMREVRQQLGQAAKHPASTVLFTGETGSGKDLAVHRGELRGAAGGNVRIGIVRRGTRRVHGRGQKADRAGRRSGGRDT